MNVATLHRLNAFSKMGYKYDTFMQRCKLLLFSLNAFILIPFTMKENKMLAVPMC